MSTDPILSRIAAGRTDLVFDALVRDADAAISLRTDGASLLQWAAYYGDVTAVRLLRERGASLSELGADFGLLGASFHGHWRLVEFLLENGADVRFVDAKTGETALHAALTNEDRERYDLVVEVLLAHGADVGARTIDGSPTDSLMRDARNRGEMPLHRAAAFGSAETIQHLLRAGADPQQKDARGDTPLAWASWHRRPSDVLRALLIPPHRLHTTWKPMRVRLLGEPQRKP